MIMSINVKCEVCPTPGVSKNDASNSLFADSKPRMLSFLFQRLSQNMLA